MTTGRHACVIVAGIHEETQAIEDIYPGFPLRTRGNDSRPRPTARRDDKIEKSGGLNRMMTVYLEKEDRHMKKKSILIGGAVAGVIAIICAWAFATKFKRLE